MTCLPVEGELSDGEEVGERARCLLGENSDSFFKEFSCDLTRPSTSCGGRSGVPVTAGCDAVDRLGAGIRDGADTLGFGREIGAETSGGVSSSCGFSSERRLRGLSVEFRRRKAGVRRLWDSPKGERTFDAVPNVRLRREGLLWVGELDRSIVFGICCIMVGWAGIGGLTRPSRPSLLVNEVTVNASRSLL